MLYQIKDATVSLGGKTILSHADFCIKEKEKIAVVGKNGAGKTTLLRVLAREINLDRDDRRDGIGIYTARKISIGFLNQIDRENQNKTVEEIFGEGQEYDVEYDKMFTGIGFELKDKNKKYNEFSGGEQTKISLIKVLLQKPDLLLLDEPTNHLDIKAIEWLEIYLQQYQGAVVIVSHDRFFLDQVVNAVYEIENRRLTRYAGNYTAYKTQKRKEMLLQKKAYERQQAEIAKLNALIEKFKHKPTKASFARSRKSMLARMEKIEKPCEDDAHIFTGEIVPEFPGSKWVYEAKHLKIGYDKEELLELSLKIRRGQKIAVIGDNGAGKTTFLKTIAGFLPPVDGESALGNNILMGYYDQMSAAIESKKTVANHFHDLFPGLTEKELRQTLGAYLFRGADVNKRVSDLSGGEKSRLALAELIQSRPNLMILDEPTNHMDIPSKETFESAFKAYKGTMLFVSHDRYFIKEVADAILLFDEKSVMYYPFGYEHFLSRIKNAEEKDIAALIQAEDQAMIAGLKAVPKPEKHRLKEIDTTEAYLDWKLRLAKEPLTQAYEEALLSYNEKREFMEENLLGLWTGEEKTVEQYKSYESEYEKHMNNWTEKCLEYYDAFLEEGL